MNIGSLLSNLDEEQASRILSQLDNSVIKKALTTGIEDQIVPHFDDVRQAAVEEYEPPEDVREKYESMPQSKQEDQFQEAAADLMAVLTQLRDDPLAGGIELKNRLRDPWMVEALLLIFNHEDTPEDVVEAQKNYAATWMKWVGVNVIPEIYTHAEAREVVEQIYPPEHVDQVLDNLDIEDEQVDSA